MEAEVGSGAGNGDMKNVASAKLEEVREWSADLLDRFESFVRERPGTCSSRPGPVARCAG